MMVILVKKKVNVYGLGFRARVPRDPARARFVSQESLPAAPCVVIISVIIIMCVSVIC